MKCPICGAEIIETEKAFQCEKHIYVDGIKSGCKFIVFKQLLNRKISLPTFQKLLAGETIPPTIFTDTKGRKFNAGFKLEKNGHGEYKIQLIYPLDDLETI